MATPEGAKKAWSEEREAESGERGACSVPVGWREAESVDMVNLLVGV
jgi:hypothetical protein